MKCPLSKNTLEEGSYPPEQEFRNCLKEECAWWVSSEAYCAVLDIPVLLVTLGNVLGKICDRMPKDLAPRGG